jgi:hypothetical protein
MALYELSTDNIAPLVLAKFASLGLLERKDLQRLIRDHIGKWVTKPTGPELLSWRKRVTHGAPRKGTGLSIFR